jgi:hypothetical protein
MHKKLHTISRFKIRNNLIPRIYENNIKQLKSLVDKQQSVCITMDLWSDPRLRGFIAFNGHFIDANWKSRCVLLEIKRFKGSHTSEAIQDNFKRVCEDYNISDKVYVINTDNAANMIAAFDEVSLSGLNDNLDKILIKYTQTIDDVIANSLDDDYINNDDNDDDDDVQEVNFGYQTIILDDIEQEIGLVDFGTHKTKCVAHTLNLVVKEGLEKTELIKTAIGKVANLVNKVHKSSNDTTVLEDLKLTLQSHNVTR